MTLLETIFRPKTRSAVPFGMATTRTRDAERPDLPALSVFLDEGVVPRASREDNHNRLGEDLSRYLVVRPGDIVFNKLRTWQGGLGVSHHLGIVSPAYFVCRPGPMVEPRFLHYLLRSVPYLAELTRLSKFMPPSQFDIGWDELKRLPLLLPPLREQETIAGFLDAETARIDALIAKKQQLVQLLAARDDTAIRGRLANVHRRWAPLKRHWQVTDCKHRTPEYVEDGYPVVSPGDVSPGRLDLTQATRFVTSGDFEDLAAGDRRPRRGDIIYSRNASIGIAAFVDTDQPFTMGQDVCVIRSETDDDLYLTYVLNTLGVDQLEMQKIGSTFSRVNISQILELEIPRPSPEEQAALAAEFDRITNASRATVDKLDRQIALLQERRQALITAAVTGQMEIPGVAA